MLAQGRAYAQGAATGKVAIARTPGDDALVARIRSELQATDVEVVELPPDAQSARRALATLAAEHGAGAALRVQRSASGVELWTASPSGAGPGTLDVIALREDDADAPDVLALGVIETLRARGLGALPSAALEQPNESAKPEPERAEEERAQAEDDKPAADESVSESESVNVSAAPMPETRAPDAGAVPQLWLELAPALALSPGGLSPELGAALAVRFQPATFASVAGFAHVPLFRAALEAQEGSASVRTWLLGVAADALLRAPPFELSAGAGIASLIAVMHGEARPPLEGVDETELVAAPLARASLHYDLGGLRLCLRALIALATPGIAVRFDDREIARWGQPFVAISLGAELPLMR